MSRENSGSFLSAVFVDYDNIYLSLKRKSEDAAKRFAKDSHRWVRAIESGRLITATNGPGGHVQRRMVMSRCYGNPVPRRNQSDNSTDMNSFPFVRHHFLRGGFEIIDCPPLTAQLKNSADIRMVMDIRDFLTHDTYFDEFVILSSDADFTPLLHRLRAHARRTVVFANDHTAAPYAALSDGEIREGDLIDLLLEDMEIAAEPKPQIETIKDDTTVIRGEIITDVVRSVLTASAPQPLEALAERAIRSLGHGKTVGTEWGGAGNFRDLLLQDLPSSVSLTEQAPYFAYDVSRAIARSDAPGRLAPPAPAAPITPTVAADVARAAPTLPVSDTPQPTTSDDFSPERASTLQDSISRIHQACKAPPLSPPEYGAVFTLLANEINTNQMQGHQTIDNVRALALELGIEAKKEDIRFIIDIVGKDDPWFEQGASPLVLASRFRNFVIGRCQEAGMQLSADEIDLIDAWFAGGQASTSKASSDNVSPDKSKGTAVSGSGPLARPQAAPQASSPAARGDSDPGLEELTARWWQETTTPRPRRAGSEAALDDLALTGEPPAGADEFPRIVRNRLKA